MTTRRTASRLMALGSLALFLAACNTKDAAPSADTTHAAPTTVAKAPTTGRMTVNGLSMYYEVHGGADRATRDSTMPPLVLLHGGGSTIQTTFGRILPALAATRRVIAVELQGHGHTPDRDAPLSFAQDADDVAALLSDMHVTTADVFGFSNGANAALELAQRHSAVVRRLVVAAGFVTRDGIPESFWTMFRQPADVSKMPPALRDAYYAAAPDTSKLPLLASKLMARLNSFRDWSDADVRMITVPTLVLIGDHDVITPEHATRMVRLLPQGQLAIMPDAVHGAYIGEATAPSCPACVTATTALLLRFLDTPDATR